MCKFLLTYFYLSVWHIHATDCVEVRRQLARAGVRSVGSGNQTQVVSRDGSTFTYGAISWALYFLSSGCGRLCISESPPPALRSTLLSYPLCHAPSQD